MTTLIISNQRTEEMVGDLDILDADYRLYTGNQAQRMAWCLREGDVLVLPMGMKEGFLEYVVSHLRFSPHSVRVLTPPPGSMGDGILSRDRLLEKDFLAELREVVRLAGVDRVLPFHFESVVAVLARELGLDVTTPGFGLLDQGGGRLLNSKSTFRALAGGADIPVPDGIVCSAVEAAAEFLWEKLLSQGRSGILKRDLHVAGYGNEIVSPRADFEPVGAQRAVVVSDRGALDKYLKERWPWLTDNGRNPVVIERYFAGSDPICVEFNISEHGIELVGHGEMRVNGHVWPASSARNDTFPHLLEMAERLCESVRVMGYRGVASVDAIVVPDGKILVNEINCRVSGSTHIYQIRDRVVGSEYQNQRVLAERRRCSFPSFSRTLDALTASGLAYDPQARTGVLLTVDDSSPSGGHGEYCVVAETTTQAQQLEQEFSSLLRLL
ncbi:hypothetical protein VT50_0228840 [Streptomyces antioxidans]|uniref:ATP-grasp domain-containing protein n=1 Tax=Streptomyces antioxidans TaxID=1507734 RepID=A0A1V4CY83_9ACTN|nr:peptide ligase PGM1-related protein [Streptomyces antioxidans]OPF73158.1 hypothetical protein VT50_0228840 [Streptomyces antioxidans]